jgi:membrane protein
MAAHTPRIVLHPLRTIAEFGNPVLSKYVRDRGPHLAAMVAYYALLSLVPFLFLTVSLLGFAGRVSANSYLIRELAHILPGQSARDLLRTVHAIQRDAGTIGTLGFVGLVWGTLGFYSALESALNIVFGVQNRAFFHQKWVTFALVAFSLSVLFTSMIVTTAATGWYHRHVPHLIDLKLFPFIGTLAATSAGIFLVLVVVYRVLTNVDLHLRDVWPGALVGTVLFQALFSALSLYLRFSNQLLALRAFGGLVLLLVWLYLMMNVIILGAEINWWQWARHQPEEPELGGLA